MTFFSPLRALVATSFVALAAVALPACPAPDPDGSDLFRLAVSGVPGGSLLAVWGPRAFPGSLWLAGGLVGVDPARLVGTGLSAGRLVEYTSGRFTTRCRTDAVLWWTHGVEREGATREVWAVGEGGTVLRYRDGRCETLPLGITFAEGPPTFWGVWAESPSDVYLVGGSAQPTGPKGVLVHYDGTSFTRVTDLPEAARNENLYKITRAASRYLIVGSGGTLLRVGERGAEATAVSAPINSSDNRMFTVSCLGANCFAVGGVASGFVLRGSPGASVFPRFESLTNLSGLNGVHVQDSENVFIVGANGLTAHIATRGVPSVDAPSYVAAPLTQATLHGVGGSTVVTLAVGGELDERTPMQRGVVLVRGDGFERFTFDGREFVAQGTLRRSLGGSGQ
jgi:photosystem II stability/assembly factor-like uncharacterized protein